MKGWNLSCALSQRFDYAVELLKDVKDPKIVILRGTLGVDADKQRDEGFMQGIKGPA